MEKGNSNDEKKTNWKPTTDRFVGFLDILGFKDMVMRNDHNFIYQILDKISGNKEKIDKLILKNRRENYSDGDVEIISFSDSIIFITKGGSSDNLWLLLIIMKNLFRNSIKAGIMMKGAIAYGEMTINKSRQIYFGQPLIDAFLLQEDVDYLGIVADSSIDRKLIEFNNTEQYEDIEPINNSLFFERTPLKKMGKISHNNLNWFKQSFTVEDSPEKIKKNFDQILKDLYKGATGSPRRYIDNTFDLIETGIKNGSIKLNNPL